MRPPKLSTVTSWSGPSAARDVMSSNEMRAPSGCDIVDRIRANTKFHSVCELNWPVVSYDLQEGGFGQVILVRTL